MIIKKHQAQSLITERPASRSASAPAREHTQPMDPETFREPDPYEAMPLSPEVFEQGQLADRRAKDRRQGYRRVEDQELISRAHEEANAIRERAAQEGFEEGLNQARDAMSQVQEAMQGLLNAREEALNSAANELAAMAVEIAERIIKTEVSCDEELVMSLVRNTIAKVGREQKSIIIKVNPIDVKVVKEAIKGDSGFSETTEIIVAEDDEVDQGSCIVETKAGQIDARFGTQIDFLKRLLLIGV